LLTLDEIMDGKKPEGLGDYLRMKRALEHVKLPDCPETNLFALSCYPLLRALNGDDNLALQPSIVGEDNQRHLVQDGQGIELTKTASSVKYVNYCQTMGFSPLSRLVKIILAEVD
jgi:hypothetical protein